MADRPTVCPAALLLNESSCAFIEARSYELQTTNWLMYMPVCLKILKKRHFTNKKGRISN